MYNIGAEHIPYLENREWMYDRATCGEGGGVKSSFHNGIMAFIAFAKSKHDYMSGEKIRCPCRACKNNKFLKGEKVEDHLYVRGFVPDYWNWVAHGEARWEDVGQANDNASDDDDETEQMEAYSEQLPWDQQMIYNAGYTACFRESHDEAGPSNYADGPNDPSDVGSVIPNDRPDVDTEIPPVDELAQPEHWRPSYGRFYDMIKASDEPLYPGCETDTKLSASCTLMSFKMDANVSEQKFNNLLSYVKRLLPRHDTLPENFYKMKKLLAELGLPMVTYDACRDGCMLFWKDDADLLACKHCHKPRYSGYTAAGKGISEWVLRYFPITPRLERMYASRVTAEHMTWHATPKVDEDIMRHPRDSLAWQQFNSKYPDFAMEARNVRLGLCADGFAPNGQFGATYSCWPVILTPYNLPPGMCMKKPYMFLSCMIPGPKNPKKLIDVYLQPLIEELQHLWYYGVETFDSAQQQWFTMHAALIWTINDFPAYGMLSGWSTAGKMGCPICMEKTEAEVLPCSHKASYFDCHRAFLDRNHSFRRDVSSFKKNKVVTHGPPPRLSGDAIHEKVRFYSSAIERPLEQPDGYGRTHKWTKRSIFWDLPYWPDNMIRHNIDPMHVEKNVFEAVFNTLFDVPGKTKDTLKARRDLAYVCDREELVVDDDAMEAKTKPKAVYTLSKQQRQVILKWLQEIRFPDGYASNLRRCAAVKDLKLTNMKSHDCHVFMQRLLPIAVKNMLPDYIWEPITELCMLFRHLCSTTLDVKQMEDLEARAAGILCKLEKIFPPAFFDSMEHVVVHLPYEATVGGPVQYRWMYPFERCV